MGYACHFHSDVCIFAAYSHVIFLLLLYHVNAKS